jgi:hypothetical protein
MSSFEYVNDLIQGHICMTKEEAEVLAKKVCVDGDHLEIGTMWGGSAILAALVKQDYGFEGKVVVIDPFCDSDGAHGHPNADIFWSNAEKLGVKDRMELIQEYSHPWPLKDRKFATALIDGNHNDPWPERDWNNVKECADVVLIHDYCHRESAVFALVESIEWPRVGEVERLVVFEK